MEEKAFYWKCQECGERLEDGEDVVFVWNGVMSGNTPSLFWATPYHKKCYKEGNEYADFRIPL